jgi:hypothetical protein
VYGYMRLKCLYFLFDFSIVIAHYNYDVVCEAGDTPTTPDKRHIFMKSSIHILPVKKGSEAHNERLKKLDYVREDLSYLNESFKLCSIEQARKLAEKICKDKTGRAMQNKATPIREGVLLIGAHHSIEDLQKLGDRLQHRFGIKTIQAFCHKDEGHYDKITNEWKPNYHAHMVFAWTNYETGKSIKLNQDDMAELQTIVAEELRLERGVSSSTKHLNSIQFKAQKEADSLKEIVKFNKTLQIRLSDVDSYSVKGLLGQNNEKTVEGLKRALKTEIAGNNEAQKLKGELSELKKRLQAIGKKDNLDLAVFSRAAQDYLKNPNKEHEIALKKSIMLNTKDKDLAQLYWGEVNKYSYQKSAKNVDEEKSIKHRH